tara:strand:- start:2114 stop:2884 length:771 start_codon:yes stop_codon:yes gene_type:complete
MPIPNNADGGANAFTAQIRQANLAEVASQELLQLSANAPFFLVHYPQNWECVTEGLDGPYWLPELQRDWLVPGCNLKRTRRRDEPVEASYDQSHLKITRQGGVILPQTIEVAGVAGYLRSLPCEHPRTKMPGTFYLDAWEVPVKRPGKRVKFNRDAGGYNRWRLALVEEGHIASPDPSVVADKLDRAQLHLERHAGKVELTSEARDRIVEAATIKIENLTGARIPKKGSNDGQGNESPGGNQTSRAKVAKRKPTSR